MMRNVKDLRGYAIRATDGVVGIVDDFYFDDQDWGIRYLPRDRAMHQDQCMTPFTRAGSAGSQKGGSTCSSGRLDSDEWAAT